MRKLLRRISAILNRRRLQQQLEEEMAAHREMMPPERRADFGSTLRLQEETADVWGFTWLDDVRQDLAYGARQLRRSPGFTFTAIAVLALGIGVNLAEAHIFNTLLHRLNVRDVDSLCTLLRITRRDVSGNFSSSEIDFYRRNNTAFSAVLTENRLDGIYHSQDSQELRAILVSGNYFAELGVTPVYGRLLDEQDNRPGAPPVAVLSYEYWQNRFGGDPGLIQRSIRLNDKPVQVVGVAPPQFAGIKSVANVWLPASQQAYLTGSPPDPRARRVAVLARLTPGTSLEAAQEQLRPLHDALARQQPETADTGDWIRVRPAESRDFTTSPAVLVLVSTCILLVLLVLLSACANLGNMLLARGLVREREIAIRLAMGAGRGRIVRQLMTENLLLAVLASVAALFVGRVAARLLLSFTSSPAALRLHTDWRIVIVCVALGLGATFAFGLAPALQMVKGGAKPTRFRQVLVSVQVATSCVLLILSSFFLRTIQQTLDARVGFDAAGLVLIDPMSYMHNLGAAEARQAAADISARVRRLPGVEGVAMLTNPPLRRPRIVYSAGAQLYVNQVDPAYFNVMRLPLRIGHVFRTDDPDAVVIGESAARKLWPGASPLGRTVHLGARDLVVAGVVADSGINLILFPESLEVYLPIADNDAVRATLFVRTSAGPGAAAIRSAAAIPGLTPLVFTLRNMIDDHFDSIRKMVRVVGSLAGIASLLALIGIFGLLAFTVAQRTREIGVRMALGARTLDVLRIVLGQYALPFGIGAACGVGLAAATARIVRNTLYGYAAFDLTSVGLGLFAFVMVALAAAIAPARRALKIDPASALRYE